MTTGRMLRTVVSAARQARECSLKQARGVRHYGAAASSSTSSCASGSHYSHHDYSNTMAACVAAVAAIASLSLVNATHVDCETNDFECMLSYPPPQVSDDDSSARHMTLDDKYTVDYETVLGQGSYGCVHPACSKATGKLVAMKKISRQLTSTAEFENETSALLRIYDQGGHANINQVLDMYEDDKYFYVILEHVAGGELLDHVVSDGAFGESDAARLAHQLASALDFLLDIGIVHADVKPENILLSHQSRQEGVIKLIDFGCAVVGVQGHGILSAGRKPKHFATANSTGTSAYWAPERFQKGLTCDAPMDMWAVGVILYIMLTGMHPFDLTGVATDAEIEAQIRKDPSPPMDHKIVGHLSASAVDLICRLMAKDPSKRMTASEMLEHPWVSSHQKTNKNNSHNKTKEHTSISTRSPTYVFGDGSEMRAPGELL